jgi:transcription elongation factor GreA
MAEETKRTWLTQEAYDRLEKELEQLSGPARREIAVKIEEARSEGDLKENGGYHAAKDEQGKMEARIKSLTELLKHAHVGDVPTSTETVSVGTVVTAKIYDDEEKFLLGHRELGENTNLDVYSDDSPLGKAILGLGVGDTTAYHAPNGAEIAVEILKIEHFGG